MAIMVLLCLRLVWLLGPGCCDRRCASRQPLLVVQGLVVLAGVDGAALRAFLSHLSALLLLSLPSVFKDTVVGREKDHNTRATGA